MKALLAADIAVQGRVQPDNLALMLRMGPGAAAAPERQVGRDTAHAGPTAVVEHWDRLITGSGHHDVQWISE